MLFDFTDNFVFFCLLWKCCCSFFCYAVVDCHAPSIGCNEDVAYDLVSRHPDQFDYSCLLQSSIVLTM